MTIRDRDIRARRQAAGEGGFTLIELLVVIIILGILAAVVVFAVGGAGDKGQKAACIIDTRTIRTAQEAYFARNDEYATNAGVLVGGGFLSEQAKFHSVVAPGVTEPARATQPPFDVLIADSACARDVNGQPVAGAVGNFVGGPTCTPACAGGGHKLPLDGGTDTHSDY